LHRKIAFYPCCGKDFAIPVKILASLVDEIIFCDIRKIHEFYKLNLNRFDIKIKFIQGDVRRVIFEIPRIKVFFYRGDSAGEGGSGVYLLRKRWLKHIIDKFADREGLLITDGSNSGHLFKKIIRHSKYFYENWNTQFELCPEQPWLDKYGLYKVKVKVYK